MRNIFFIYKIHKLSYFVKDNKDIKEIKFKYNQNIFNDKKILFFKLTTTFRNLNKELYKGKKCKLDSYFYLNYITNSELNKFIEEQYLQILKLLTIENMRSIPI